MIALTKVKEIAQITLYSERMILTWLSVHFHASPAGKNLQVILVSVSIALAHTGSIDSAV